MAETTTEPLRALEQSLGEELMRKYLSLLRQWYSLSSNLNKVEFQAALRKILTTEEQFRYHNELNWSHLLPKYYAVKPKASASASDKGVFEMADCSEYMQPLSEDCVPPVELEYRSAASELFVPDSNFIKARLAIHAWENKLQVPGESVVELMVHASQIFIKNIITAMISRKEGYRLRENKLQYGFGLPVPDPFIRNSNNIREYPQDPEDENYIPPSKMPVDAAEQQAAFLYSCGKKKVTDGKLTLQLLYDTLRENPRVVGLDSVHSVNLFKISLLLDEE